MEKTSEVEYSPYYVRRLTPLLLKSLIPEFAAGANKPEKSDESFWDFVKKAGVAIKDIFKAALFQKKDESPATARKLKKGEIPNTYGYFLVSIHQGQIEVYTDPGVHTPSAGSELFLVADLVGLPLARISGGFEKNIFSSAKGQSTSAHYAVDLWLDPGISSWDQKTPSNLRLLQGQDKERVGRFIQTLMFGRDDLTIDEFCREASRRLKPAIANITELPGAGSANSIDEVKNRIRDYAVRMLGVTAIVHVRPSSQIYKHQLTIDESTLRKVFENQALRRGGGDKDSAGYWKCSACAQRCEVQFRFCQECGTPKPIEAQEMPAWGRRMVTSEGDDLVLDLDFVSYDESQVDFEGIAAKVIDVLRPYVRKYSIQEISDPDVISTFVQKLNSEFSIGTVGDLGEFSIIDFRTANLDWQLQSRAQIKEQLRIIGANEGQLQVDSAAIALRQAQLAIARLRRGADFDEAQEALERRKIEVDIEKSGLDIDLQRSSATASHEIAARRIDISKEMEQERLERELERDRRKLDREDFVSNTETSRDDQLREISHDMDMENRVLVHDISKKDLADEAQRRTRDKELEFEERVARLRATRGIDIARSENELEIERKRKDLELDLSERQFEQEMQLRKLQLMGDIERQQKLLYKDLTPAQILAMQATSLAERGATDALTNLASGGAEAERRNAEDKAAMYERMLQMQDNNAAQLLRSRDASEDRQLEMMRVTLAQQTAASDKVEKALNRSVESAEKVTKDSIGAMSQVASSASETRGDHRVSLNVNEARPEKSCGKCGATNAVQMKFCGDCGTSL